MIKKKKILIVYNFILHYRKPLFNLLAKEYDITVLHSGNKTITENDTYSEKIVPFKKLGPFYFQKGLINEIRTKKYDVIIALFDLRWVHTIYSVFKHNKETKFILWGAWFTKFKLANKIRLFLTKKADASIFYTYSSMKDFIDNGIDSSSLYVANNTFDVGERIKSYEFNSKFRILFVGSLDKRKQNKLLLVSFANILIRIPKHIMLTIVGDGAEFEALKKLSKQLQIEQRVEFVGRINDPKVLKKYYAESLLSVSIGQAGLSVLQAMGFGVPFLTKKNAISGGEITNIKHRYNGILCDDDIESIESNLVYACNNVNIMLKMGHNAYNYYSKFCTIENYVLGFKDAIEETRTAKVDVKI